MCGFSGPVVAANVKRTPSLEVAALKLSETCWDLSGMAGSGWLSTFRHLKWQSKAPNLDGLREGPVLHHEDGKDIPIFDS